MSTRPLPSQPQSRDARGRAARTATHCFPIARHRYVLISFEFGSFRRSQQYFARVRLERYFPPRPSPLRTRPTILEDNRIDLILSGTFEIACPIPIPPIFLFNRERRNI